MDETIMLVLRRFSTASRLHDAHGKGSNECTVALRSTASTCMAISPLFAPTLSTSGACGRE